MPSLVKWMPEVDFLTRRKVAAGANKVRGKGGHLPKKNLKSNLAGLTPDEADGVGQCGTAAAIGR